MKKLTGLLCLLFTVAVAACDDDDCKDPTAVGCVQTEEPQAQLYGMGLQQTRSTDMIGVAAAVMPFTGEGLPSSFDLSSQFPPPGDQGQQFSCVGWAVGYGLKSFQERVEENWSYTNGASLDFNHVFSPSWVYNQINGGRDNGSYFADALNLIRDNGASPFSYMQYDSRNPFHSPTSNARAAASPYRIASWRSLDPRNLVEIKSQVASGFPVVIGVIVDETFQRLPAGQVWRTRGGESGRHAMLIVGYDDGRSAFKVLNSWGQQWSAQGYGWIGYDHFLRIEPEAYVARDMPNGGAAPPPSPPSPVAPVDPAMGSSIAVTNVTHNIFIPNVGLVMRFDGTISVPPGAGSDFQVVVQLYYNSAAASGGIAKGGVVRATVPAYAMPDGQAATGAPRVPLPGQGVQTGWFAFLPYGALNIPRGLPAYIIQSDLVAEPVLYVDGFGIKRASLIPFYVRL